MLHLKIATPRRWLTQIQDHLPELLVDHAHCEKKAASTAMNLLFAYLEHESVARAMAAIAIEELEHFGMVLDQLERRRWPLRRLRPGSYGRRLHEHQRKQEPARAVDRLLIAGLIEARSCKRFELLTHHVADAELAEFYAGLFESEARHHATYVRLAEIFAPADVVRGRLEDLATVEAELIAMGDVLPRMHS